jgi:hypothetical protein
MSIDPAILRAMAEAGASVELILVAVEAAKALDDAKLVEKRAKDAARQRKSRTNRELSHPVTVTPRDTCDTPPPEEPQSLPPNIEGNQTPSTPKENPLRGEKKGTRLPADWQPDEALRRYASQHGFTGVGLSREIEKFRNYWLAKPGKDARKLDWSATWRTWILNGNNRGPPQPQPGQSRWAI